MAEPKKGPSQRQLRIGEEIRHAISDILFRNEIHNPLLESVSITVSEVRISPDLKNATVFVEPLAGSGNPSKLIAMLNEQTTPIRKLLGKHLILRYSPKLHFKRDTSFESANRVNELLNRPEVLRDVLDEKPE